MSYEPLTLFAITQLSAPEQDELTRYEKTIERGLETFVRVGDALLAIRRDRLYRATHATFEAYCEQRWQMTRSYASRLIGAAEVVGNLSPIGNILPTTESQARPLTQLEPEQQREAWTRAVDISPNGKPTAAIVQRVADEYKEQAEELSGDGKGYDWTAHDAPGTEDDLSAGMVGLNRDYTEEEYDDLVEANAVVLPRPHVANNSGNNEWYTPIDFIEAARLTLGTIELDPATSDEANATVRATNYYTIDDDGLTRQWHGKVWMNPPYAGDLVGRFIDKLLLHFQAKDVDEAIVLVNNATETRWFQTLAECASAICFPASRIRFSSPNGVMNTPLQGQAILYLGTSTQDFIDNFDYFGLLVKTAKGTR